MKKVFVLAAHFGRFPALFRSGIFMCRKCAASKPGFIPVIQRRFRAIDNRSAHFPSTRLSGWHPLCYNSRMKKVFLLAAHFGRFRGLSRGGIFAQRETRGPNAQFHPRNPVPPPRNRQLICSFSIGTAFWLAPAVLQ